MAEAKPITTDPDEKELLEGMGIPLTDPAVKVETDPPAVAEAVEAVVDAQEKVDDKDGVVAEVPAGEAGDSVAGAGSSDAVVDADRATATPVTPAVTPAAEPARQPLQIQPDAILGQLDSAIEKLKTNEFLEEWEKDAKLADLMVKREEHVDRLVKRQTEANDNAWAAAEKHYGVPRAQLQPLNQQIGQDLWNRGFRGEALEGARTVILEQKAAALRENPAATIAAAVTPSAPKPKPAVAPTPITAAGARVAPPSSTSVPAKPKPKTDEEELVEWNRKNVPGGIRALVR